MQMEINDLLLQRKIDSIPMRRTIEVYMFMCFICINRIIVYVYIGEKFYVKFNPYLQCQRKVTGRRSFMIEK